MEINVAKSAGFCFGVKRALNIAHKTTQELKKVYMLGDLVHNEQVVEETKKMGIKKVKRLNAAKGRTFLIRAHGCSLKLIKRARGLGYKIVDATCPMVKEIHAIAKREEAAGNTLIVIGDKKHDEVRGIIGQLATKAFVIDRPESIPVERIARIKKCAVVVQSTQNQEKVDAIVSRLKLLIPKLKVFNTICLPTRIKQREIKKLPLENDLVIIIGSKASANTKRLFELSKTLNEKTYWVQNKLDLKKKWFCGVKKIGVTSGASTPDSTTAEVIKHIERITGNKSQGSSPSGMD